MFDPYRMIVVNVTFLIALVVLVLSYKIFFPTRKINLFYILIFLTTIASISIFRIGSYESGDFNIHIYRSMEFYKSLLEGNLMPSWAPHLNATYGYPLFVFNYSLPYYFISLFHFIGFSFISSLKLFLFFNMLFTSIFIYTYIKNKFKNELSAFTASIIYVFFPYHLVSVHFKITIGEVFVFTLLPLLFLSLDKLSKENKKYLLLSGVVLGLIALSHIFIAIFLIPMIFLYCWVSKTKLIHSFTIVLIGLLISSYQWSPSLIFNNVLFTTKYPIDIYTIYFPSIADLIYSPWRYGFLFQGPKGEISYLLGYAQLIIVGYMLFLSLKNKIPDKYKAQLQMLLGLLFMLILLMLPISRNMWDALPLLGAAGSHRLLIITGLIITLLSAYAAIIVRDKKWIYILIFFAVLSTLVNWGQRRVIPEIDDKVLENNISLSTYLGEAHFYANTKFINPRRPWFLDIPNNKMEVLKGKASFSSEFNGSTVHKYKALVSENSLVSEKTLYFPGWSAYLEGKSTKIFPGKEGEINFYLPKGNHNIEIIYKDVFLLKLAKIISISSLFFTFIYFLWSLKLHKFK